MRYGDAGTIQLTYPVGALEARWCGVGPVWTAPGGGPQLVCATRDGWPGGTYYGLQAIGTGLPTSYFTTTTPIAGLQTTSGQSLWGWAFESNLRVWIASSTPQGSVFLYERPTEDVAWTLTGTYLIDSSQASYSLIGRWEGADATRAFYLYTCGPTRVIKYNTRTFTAQTLVTAQNSNINFRSVSFAPQGLAPASPSATRTGTSSPSQTASASQTPTNTGSSTPSPSSTGTGGLSPSITGSNTPSASITASATATPIVAVFRQGNILVLRVANSTALGYIAGRYVPAWIDEIEPVNGYVVNSYPLPTTNGTNPDGSFNLRCTIPLVNGGESYIQLTADRRALTLPCYDASPATPVNNSGIVKRVFAAVWADGRIDTTTSCADCYTTTNNAITINLRSCASSDVFSGFVLTGFSSSAITTGGVRYVAYRGTTSVQLSTNSPRFVRVENSIPYLTGGPVIAATISNGAGQIGLGYYPLPAYPAINVVAPATWTMVTGQEASQTWGTIAVDWQYAVNPTGDVIYLSDSSNGGASTNGGQNYNIQVLTRNAALNRYAMSFLQIDNTTACQYVAGQTEASLGGSPFALYIGCQNSRVYQWNTATNTRRIFYTPPTGNFILGVSLPPVDSRYLPATPSFTPSNTPSSSQTPSVTPSPSNTATNTASITATPTTSASNTQTPTTSQTSSLSVGASPSNTATPSNQVSVFPPSSLVVLRSGNGSAALWRTGIANPVYLDIYDPSAIMAGYPATALTTIALPQVAGSGTLAGRCTLAYGSGWDRTATGASRSADGTRLSWPCYDVAPGANITYNAAGAPITVAMVRPDGVIDTSTRPGNSYIGTAAQPWNSMVRAAYMMSAPGGAAPDGFWLTGSSATQVGIRWAAYGSTVGSVYVGNPADARSIMLTSAFNNRGAGSPTGSDPVLVVSGVSTGTRGLAWLPVSRTLNESGLGTSFLLLPGWGQQALLNPDQWAFHAGPDGRVFVADSRSGVIGGISVYTFNALLQQWMQMDWLNTGVTDPIYSMVGRQEAGVTVLYAVSQSATTFASAVYRIDTATRVVTRIIANAANTQIRAVMLPPVADVLAPSTSLTPSALATTSPGATASRSATASVSATSSASATVSTGAAPSQTAPAPTALPIGATARFLPSSLLILRGGNSTPSMTAGTATRLLPLYFDVINPDPANPVRLVETIAVPAESDPATGNRGCTLAFSTTGEFVTV